MAGYKVINSPFYVVTVFSLTLLLFILGWTLTSLILSTNFISDFKEQINIVAELNDDQKNTDEIILNLKSNSLVKGESVKYVSQEQALALMKKELGSTILAEGMDNPFQEVVQFNMNAEDITLSNLDQLERQLKGDFGVQGLYYPPDLFSGIQRTFRAIGMYGLIGVAILFAIVILLIHQIIKMNIITNKFIIRTMEMVGALPVTIRKPFRSIAFRIGLISGILGVIFYAGSVFLLPQVRNLASFEITSPSFLGICGFLIVLSIVLCMISSRLAISKYLS